MSQFGGHNLVPDHSYRISSTRKLSTTGYYGNNLFVSNSCKCQSKVIHRSSKVRHPQSSTLSWVGLWAKNQLPRNFSVRISTVLQKLFTWQAKIVLLFKFDLLRNCRLGPGMRERWQMAKISIESMWLDEEYSNWQWSDMLHPVIYFVFSLFIYLFLAVFFLCSFLSFFFFASLLIKVVYA